LKRHFLKACAETVRKILKKEPQPLQKRKPKAKKKPQRRFVSSTPNQLWQMDIMTWMLRGVHRVYLICCLDDCSRFITGWGLFMSQTGGNVLEVLRSAIEKHGCPEEILTDNGRQFYSWRGKARFQKTVTKMGIHYIRSSSHHP
jgi:transposase InsO family protein